MNNYNLTFAETRHIEEILFKNKITDYTLINQSKELEKYYLGTTLIYWFSVLCECKINNIKIKEYIYLSRYMERYDLTLQESFEITNLFSRFIKTEMNENDIVEIYLYSKNNEISIEESYKKYEQELREEIEQSYTIIEELMEENLYENR
jgi:predicted nucleotidyltransferase